MINVDVTTDAILIVVATIVYTIDFFVERRRKKRELKLHDDESEE